MEETDSAYFLDDGFYSYDEDRLHRMAMRYRKISSQIIQIYLDSCHFGEQHVIQSMIQENALTEHVVNYRDSNGRTGLSYACEYGYDDVVKTLAGCGDGVIDPNVADKEGNSPLMYAAQAGHDMCVSVLLNYYPTLDLDHINNLGTNALMKAAIQGNSECARLLILSGASPFLTDPSRNLAPDAWAAYCGRNATAELIRRLKVTLGPKLCSLCGYTKPLGNCPGHIAGLCKTHTPCASRIDISAPFASNSTGHPNHVKLKPCKVVLQCPSGNVIDLISTSVEPSGDLGSNERVHTSLGLGVQMKQLKGEDPSSATSCPSLPNCQTSSSPEAKRQAKTQLSDTNVPKPANTTKQRKKRFRRLLSLFSCVVDKEKRTPKQNYRKDSSPGSSYRGSKRRHSYSRYAQVSRRISFSS